MLLRSISELDEIDINKDSFDKPNFGVASYIEVSIKNGNSLPFDSKKLSLSALVDWIVNRIELSCIDLLTRANCNHDNIAQLSNETRALSNFIEENEIKPISSLLKLSCSTAMSKIDNLSNDFLYKSTTDTEQTVYGKVKFIQDIDGCALSAKWG